ncbi:PKD domain-containing protein [Namhaeicola litoreus]|uniref:PKD domain-containing protein n=1 Tax=Namhaeicola litoreus TaxID=1052145 RepID=A0ABW3Y0W8_9FLAO
MMTTNKNFSLGKSKGLIILLAILTSVSFLSCDDYFEFDLPEEGSIEDKTPPSANFGAMQSDTDWMTYTFSNLSNSATDYLWDFGDGNTSTELEPSFTFPGEGTFSVTLTASDKLGVTSTVTKEVEVIEPEAPAALLPPVLEGSFEDGTLPDGSGDGRDSWRTDLGGVIQITSSPVYDGSQAAKFPSAGDRVGYQELTLTPNTDYKLIYYYTMKEEAGGNLTVSVLGGSITDLSQVPGATLASHIGTDNTSSDTYVKVELPFNTGANSTVAILITNEVVECRADGFSLELVEE